MKKSFTILFLFSAFILFGQSQNYSDSIKKALVNMYSQLYTFPHEKIYVQTDRPYYISGEKIFFRSFLLHGSTRKPVALSRYVYVELVSPVDTVVLRRKILIDEDKMFYGSLTLPEFLPEGDYRIRAYTRYMENSGEPSFYTRPVFIANPNSFKIKLEPEFNFIRKGQVGVKLRFKDVTTTEVPSQVQIELQLGNSKKKIIAKPTKDGWLYEKFDLEDNDTQRTLLVEYKDIHNSFGKYIQIPYNESSPDISFYPEGGSLIAEQSNRIAFKALLPGGKSADINGSIFNSRNEQQTTFTTQHEGMGVFCLYARLGESYYARYVYNNLSYEIKLTAAKTDAYSLQALWDGDSLSVSVRKPDVLATQNYYLLIHRQGIPTYFQLWDFSKKEVKWNKDQFATGVTHLMLLNENLQPVSERMIFNNLNDNSRVEIEFDQKIYKPREHVSLDIHLLNTDTATVLSSFSIAVTDNKDVKVDTTTNILAEILLTSELEGQIGHPAWYFGRDKEALESADLLMLTHGWRNYHVSEALVGKLQKPGIKPEVSQSFSGMLRKTTGKPYKNGKIKILVVGNGFSEVVEADDFGRYCFTDFEFADSTAYFFQAFSTGKIPDIEIYPDAINYPTITKPLNFTGSIVVEEQQSVDFADYVSKANLKYLQQNGIRQIQLPELTVKATPKKEKRRLDNHVVPIEPDRWISPDDIKQSPSMSFEQLLWRIPGVTEVSEKGVIIRGGNAKIVLNGIERSYKELEQIVHVIDIAQVDLYTGTGVTMMWGALCPVIVLTTWPSGELNATETEKRNIKLIVPLGYQKTVEFYSPKYDTPEALNNKTPDLRSTIYWKPNVVVDAGYGFVDFYTADTPTSYSVVIEGVAAGGKLIYYRKNNLIKVEK